MNKFLRTFARKQRGLTTVEYAVAGGLIVAGLVGAFTGLGNKVLGLINVISASLG